MTTPRIGLPYIATGQAQKEVTHNEALNRIDSMVQPIVMNTVTSAPPGAPVTGQAWIIAAGATGAWAGREGQIAAWFGGWQFFAPADGWSVWDASQALRLVFGGGAWRADVMGEVFASPNAGGIITGEFYDNSFHGAASTTLAGAADRIDMAPFFTARRLRIDQLGVAVSSAVASALLRCCVYAAGANGWPDALLFEGESNLDGATTGLKAHTLDFTFEPGRQYWLGVRHSSTATIRAIGVGAAASLGLNGGAGANYFTILRRTLAFATPLPANWNFVSGDRVANVGPPSVRMRAAA